MTTILESIREFYNVRRVGTSLSAIDMLISGDVETLDPPFIGLTETAANEVQQGDVVLHGVYAYEIACELFTVPGETADTAINAAIHDQMRWDLLNIFADKSMIQWTETRNLWRIFDIRASGPTMEAEDGQRVTTINLTVIACPRV